MKKYEEIDSMQEKNTKIHPSNWKMYPYDSIIIMYLPRFHGVTAAPVQSARFDLQLMSSGLSTNVSFYFACGALGNVVMSYFIIFL